MPEGDRTRMHDLEIPSQSTSAGRSHSRPPMDRSANSSGSVDERETPRHLPANTLPGERPVWAFTPPTRPAAGPSSQTGDLERPTGATGPAPKKKARRLSQIPAQTTQTTQNGTSPAQNKQQSATTSRKGATGESNDSPPAVLTREKKQKACANCRRAKLKCLVSKGETDCVRCQSRGERCIFYTRSHEEDWQQTLTADVYSAITHVASLSNAVHHLLHHLVTQNVIPPLPQPLDTFDPPERNIELLQGWAAERNQELGEESKKRKKTEPLADLQQLDDSHDDLRRMPATEPQRRESAVNPLSQYDSEPPARFDARHNWNHPSDGQSSGVRQSRSENQGVRQNANSSGSRYPLSITTPTSHSLASRSSVPLLASYEREDSNPFGSYSQQPSRMPPPPNPMSVPLRQHSLSHEAPISALQQTTPNSYSSSSPLSAGQQAFGLPPPWFSDNTNDSSQVPSQSLLDENSFRAPTLDGPPTDDVLPVTSQDPMAIFAEMPEGQEDVAGSADPRKTIIKKNILSAPDAKALVEFFHSSLSPHLFGYHLQLRQFPYLPKGLMSMTPFILAVECLLAAERVPSLYHYHSKLADEVLDMILTSPAESWQTIQNIQSLKEQQKGSAGEISQGSTTLLGEQVLGKAWATMGDDEWDDELGIGPEEIVAACALATFIAQRKQAKHIADVAFMWARGWTKSLMRQQAHLETRTRTFAETVFLVTPLREASEADMARIWLLSYIAAGQEATHSSEANTSIPEDPRKWCRILLLDTDAPITPPNPHDVLLVYHAKLLALLQNWHKDRVNILRPSLDMRATGGAPPSSELHKRLASRTNGNLDWWQDDLEQYRLGDVWTGQIQLDWLYAKVLVNSVASKNLWGGADEGRLREASRGLAVDSAMQLLRRCAAWTPREDLTNLPHAYLRMIGLAVSEVVEALQESEQGSCSHAACPVTRSEALPILLTVSDMLSLGGLQEGHDCRRLATSMRHHVGNFSRSTVYR